MKLKKLEQFDKQINNNSRINIVKAKYQFKLFFLSSLFVTLIFTLLIIYLFIMNFDRIYIGILFLIITTLLIISHILYVRSRDKIEIIDYYSLKYYSKINPKISNKIRQFSRYLKTHIKSFVLMLITMIYIQFTWLFTICRMTNIVSFSILGFFFVIFKLPFELKFKSYQKNAIIDSVRSDEVVKKYIDRIRMLGWNDKNRQEYSFLIEKVNEELRIRSRHNDLLVRTTILYYVPIYISFAIIIEIFGLIMWSQWLNLIL